MTDIDTDRAVAGLRSISRGFAELADALQGHPGADREAAVARIVAQVPRQGIKTAALAELFRTEGLDARSIGGWVRTGVLVADKDNPLRASAERVYYPGE